MSRSGRLPRLVTTVLLGILVLGLFAPAAFAAGTDDKLDLNSVQSAGYPKVTFRVTVSNPRGAPVPPLSPEDFVVEENGQNVGPVGAYALALSPTPLSFVMAIDVSGSMNDAGKIDGAKSAAKTFVGTLRTFDRVEVITFSDRVTTVVPFTTDHAAVDQGIDKVVANGNTALYDGTTLAVNDVLRTAGTRFVIVLSDGEDTTSKSSLDSVLGLARQTQIPIYTIGLGGDVKDDILGRMASDTSGVYFKAPRASDLNSAFRLLTEQLNHEYEVYYFSPSQGNSEMMGKKLDVKVRLQGQNVPQLQGAFSYTVPTVAQFDPGKVDPGQLRPVEDAPAAPQPAAVAAQAFSPELAEGITFLAVIVLLAGLSTQFQGDNVDRRLATFVGGLGRAVQRRSDDQGGQLGRVLLTSLARAVSSVLPASQVESIRRDLLMAGNPYGWDVQEFIGLRVLVALTLGGLGYLAEYRNGPTSVLLYSVGFAALGFILPAVWLSSKIQKRQRAIFRAMPNALDLLAVSVEAGLGLDQAIGEVCAKWQNELTREFALFLNEIRVGRSRHDALRGMVDRTGVPELSGFVTAVIQADELGAGIANTLAVQAEQIRIKRRQYAEKLAHEAAIKMIFPLVFLMFPAIFVVLLGPAIPLIMDTLGGSLK